MPSRTIDTLHEFSAACTGVTIAVQQDAWGFTMLPNLVSQFYSLTRTWALVSPETCLTICIMSQDSRRVPANRCTVPLSVEVAPALDASSRSHLQSHLQRTAWSSNFFKRLPRWQKRFISSSSVQNVHPKTRCSRCLNHFTPNASPCREIRSHQAKSSTRLFNESAYLSPHYFPVQYILSNYIFDTSPLLVVNTNTTSLQQHSIEDIEVKKA